MGGGKKNQKKGQAAAKKVDEVAKKVEEIKVEESGDDVSKDCYGVFPLHQSQSKEGPKYTEIQDLIHGNFVDKEVCIRGRLHRSRVKGKLCFVVMRDRHFMLQSVLSAGEKVSKEMIKFVGGYACVLFVLNLFVYFCNLCMVMAIIY